MDFDADQNELVIVGNTLSNNSGGSTCSATSSDFPLCSGSGGKYFQSVNNGNQDTFISTFDAASFTLNWSTFYGGASDDWFTSVDMTQQGNVTKTFVVGGSISTPGTVATSPILSPLSTGLQLNNPAGSTDYFQSTRNGREVILTCFNHVKELEWASFFGGSGSDNSSTIKADKDGDILVSGYTGSSVASSNQSSANNTGAFPIYHPTTTAYTQNYGGGPSDLFIARFGFNHDLQWSTYLGAGATDDHAGGTNIATDALGDVYICGSTNEDVKSSANDMPVMAVPGRYNQPQNATNQPAPISTGASGLFSSDGYIAQFRKDNSMKWATHYGAHVNVHQLNNNEFENLNSIACSGTPSSLFFAGSTQCSITPNWDPGLPAYYQSYQGGGDNMIGYFYNTAKLGVSNVLTQSTWRQLQISPNPTTGMCTVVFDNETRASSGLVSIFDISGKCVAAEPVSLTSGNNRLSITLSKQPAGVYIINLEVAGKHQRAKVDKL